MSNLHDVDNWWHSLTEKWKAEIFKVYSEYSLIDYEPVEATTYTKHIDPNEPSLRPMWQPKKFDEIKDYDDIRRELASKAVWDQDRFPREKAMDEDRFKDRRDPMTEDELKDWLRGQGQRGPSKRYG